MDINKINMNTVRIAKEFKCDMKKNTSKEEKYKRGKIIRFAKERIFKQ